MIWYQGQLMVYDKLDEHTQQKAQIFIATIAHAVKQSKGEPNG